MLGVSGPVSVNIINIIGSSLFFLFLMLQVVNNYGFFSNHVKYDIV